MAAPPNPTTTVHPSLHVVPLPGRGMGSIATARIPRGTRLVSDAPVFAATNTQWKNEELLAQQLIPLYAGLPADQRTRIDNLAANPEAVARWAKFFGTEDAVAEAEASWATDPDPAAATSSSLSVAQRAHIMASWNTNCFGLYNNESAAKWAAVIAPTAARFNHACVPNATFAWNDAVGAITVQTIKEVDEGEELTIAYVDSMKRGKKRREALSRQYGFVCDCPACADGKEEELNEMRKRTEELREILGREAKRGEDGRDGEIAKMAVEEGVTLHEKTGLVGVHLADFYKAAFAATGDRLYLEEELRVRTYCLGDDHPLVKALTEKLTGV
ncbi:hypothetical protein BFW01_g8656 [Lasiodiplodia theobromae]|uniref:Putative SET domain-containing protein n=1 Tax=Lasiodiplodia theobromae TaxID=45133 RepID=A0A5N5DMZ9_9PEZI|nr:putative SET domain-containing protein [Lasiodiplodia theobromae]KAF9637760.1 hypothetical protein BFW01_g8656 [Lasiodiplodia theobromae]